jgi:hypothetical protein
MYLTMHMQQAEIAAALSARKDVGYETSIDMVAKDLKVLRKRWMDSALLNIDKAKAEELARIDALEIEYRMAWERELVPEGREITYEEEIEDVDEQGHQHDKKGDWTHKKTTVKTKTRVGPQNGPAWALQGMERCVEQRCKILGLNAPIKEEHTGKDGTPLFEGATIYLPENGRDNAQSSE